MFKTFILRYVAGNLDRLISFLQEVDKYVDAYVITQATKANVVQDQIRRLETEKAQLDANANLAVKIKQGVRNVLD